MKPVTLLRKTQAGEQSDLLLIQINAQAVCNAICTALAECFQYASGGRLPIVMMNANRSTALPWNIYGDQRDSVSQLDCGWIQVYVEDAQESLDMALQSFFIAEH